MKRILFIKLLCLSSVLLSDLQAQAPYELIGILKDSTTQKVLPVVNIFNQTSGKGTYSDIEGRFEMVIEKLPTTLIFSSIGYENYLLTIDQQYSDTIEILLKPSSFELPRIEITAKPEVQKLTDPGFTVKDFIIKDDLILLVKNKNGRGGNILELHTLDGQLLHSKNLKVKGAFEKLHHGCLGNIHLLGKKENIEIDIQSKRIELIARYPRPQFEEFVRPCVESSDDFIYLKKSRQLGQYCQIDFVSKSQQKIVRSVAVGDYENMRRMRDDLWQEGIANRYYSVLTPYTKLPHEVGIQRPKWIDSWKVLFFKPIFSPIHDTGQELCIFNHTVNFLQFYSYNGKYIKQLPISYHQEKRWEKQILKDRKTGKFYTFYKNKSSKHFYEINLQDGSIKPVLLIEHNFVEKMVIYDGCLYYQDSGILYGETNRVLHKVKLAG